MIEIPLAFLCVVMWSLSNFSLWWLIPKHQRWRLPRPIPTEHSLQITLIQSSNVQFWYSKAQARRLAASSAFNRCLFRAFQWSYFSSWSIESIVLLHAVVPLCSWISHLIIRIITRLLPSVKAFGRPERGIEWLSRRKRSCSTVYWTVDAERPWRGAILAQDSRQHWVVLWRVVVIRPRVCRLSVTIR